jgi:hypothetical protein
LPAARELDLSMALAALHSFNSLGGLLAQRASSLLEMQEIMLSAQSTHRARKILRRQARLQGPSSAVFLLPLLSLLCASLFSSSESPFYRGLAHARNF